MGLNTVAVVLLAVLPLLRAVNTGCDASCPTSGTSNKIMSVDHKCTGIQDAGQTRDRTLDECRKDIQLSNLTKTIVSPGYPSLYNRSLSCGRRINASSPERLVGVLYAVQFESSNCQHGSLSFYDGSDNSSRLLLLLCGTGRGGILSSGDTMYIQFTSSTYGTSYALTVNSTEKCGGTFIATSQMTNFTVPGAPYVSYGNLNCKWIIISENENDTVQVKSDWLFHYVGNLSDSCSSDIVRVYNGNTTEADQFLGEYCSTQMPNFYSSTNSLLLMLTTNVNETGIGVRMQYSSLPEGNCKRTHIIYNTPIYILSPGYPNYHSSNLTCSIFLDDAHYPRNLRLDVLTADMEGTYPQCDNDSVRLFSGDFGIDYLAGKFCGNSSVSPIGPYYSNGMLMTVKFKSLGGTSGKIFRLRVSHTSRKVIPHQSYNCGPQFRNATSEPKLLSSPEYPVLSGYEDNCIWTVMASSPEMMVRILVTDSDFPSFKQVCDYIVTFYNGPSIFNDTIFSWCGDSKPTLQSTGSAMTIQFQTRYYSPYLKGFRLKYFTTNETYRCGGTVHITTGGNRTLRGPYQNSQDCHWKIHAPTSMNIQIKVTNGHVIPTAKPKTCNADYVEIYNGSSNKTSSTSIGKWCGQYSDEVISSGSTITARFHSEIDNRYRGIQLILTAGHFSGSRMTSLSANYTNKYITSPNYPFKYPSNSERTWKIDAGEYYRVKIKVTYSQLESSVDCQNDYVEAFDGSDAKAASLGRWCGTTTPNKTSSGSVMFLKFKSNSHVVDRGFIIMYTVDFVGFNISTPDYTTTAIAFGSLAGLFVLSSILGGVIGAVRKRRRNGSKTVS